jgi:hypothetical protein
MSSLDNIIALIEEEFPHHSWVVRKIQNSETAIAKGKYAANIMALRGANWDAIVYGDTPHAALQNALTREKEVS